MSDKRKTLLGLAFAVLSVVSKAKAQQQIEQNFQPELSVDDQNTLNTIIQYRQLKLTNKNDTQLYNYQVVSQEELIDAIQSNNLEQLLLKKGVLIQKQSAEATVCQKCNSGN